MLSGVSENPGDEPVNRGGDASGVDGRNCDDGWKGEGLKPSGGGGGRRFKFDCPATDELKLDGLKRDEDE